VWRLHASQDANNDQTGYWIMTLVMHVRYMCRSWCMSDRVARADFALIMGNNLSNSFMSRYWRISLSSPPRQLSNGSNLLLDLVSCGLYPRRGFSLPTRIWFVCVILWLFRFDTHNMVNGKFFTQQTLIFTGIRHSVCHSLSVWSQACDHVD
jgi:hypothetical protein